MKKPAVSPASGEAAPRRFNDVMRTIFRLYVSTKEFLIPWGGARFLGGIGAALLGVFSSYLMGRMVEVALSNDMTVLIRYAIFMVSMVVARVILSYVNILTQERYSYHSGRKLKRMSVDRINVLPICYFERNHTGQTISKLGSDLEKLEMFFGNSIAGIWSFVPTQFIASFILLARVDLPLTLICGTTIPLFSLLIGKVSIPMGEQSKRRQEEIAVYNSLIRDFVEGAPIYKVYNMHRTFLPKFHQACARVAESSFAISKRRSLTMGLSILGMLIPQIIAISAGMVFVSRGSITVAELFIFSNVLWPFVFTFQQVSHSWNEMVEEAGRADHFFALIDSSPERSDVVVGTDEAADPVIRFDQVTYAYADEHPVLEAMSFSVGNGTRTALVGASGSGKSTVHKLICGYYDEYSGAIEVFGRPVSRWNLDDLRSRIAVVTQDVFLFNDSVLDNIRYGRLEASDEEVIDAARRAGCHEFIEELEDGYRTKLGERGHRLSGGQQQRISVARALLKDAPLVLLDEPTSALDTRSEHQVQRAIEELARSRTVFVIAHRLSTIEHADEILVIDEGRICARGTHARLVEESARYRALYQRQIVFPEVAP